MPKNDSGDSKISKKKAALIIQRYGKGWLERHFYNLFRQIAQTRGETCLQLLQKYEHHIYEIVERHDCVNMDRNLNLREICDYYLKLEKYEIAFDEVCSKDRDYIDYEDLYIYFEVLTLTPTRAEIRFACEKILQESADVYRTFPYRKNTVIDIALHIFVPRGSHLQNTRKSTWLCPIVGNDDVLRFTLKARDTKKVKLSKCMKAVTSMKSSKPPIEEEQTLSSNSEKGKQKKKRKEN